MSSLIVVVCVAELKKSHHSTEAMKKQSEGLHKEYDRLSEEYSRLQVSHEVFYMFSD